jgi:hypothetical protein
MAIQPIKIDTFGGMTPVIDDRLLPNSGASQAVNTWLFSGRIEPVHSMVPIHTMANPNALSYFRLPKVAPGIDYMASSWWLEFLQADVRVIRSPTAGQDDDGRYYWADGTFPKMMTGTMIENADVAPPVLNSAVASGTGGTYPPGVTIFYVVTAINATGETVASNELSATTPAGPSTASFALNWSLVTGATGYRIYRGLVTGDMIGYIPIASGTTASYVDTGGTTSIDGTPPLVDTFITPPLALGVPTPETAPGVSVSGGGSVMKTVSYVYTWVTALGEEGPPSPPHIVQSGPIDATYTISLTAPTPSDNLNRQLATTRIYRTVVSAQGVATFFFVAEIPITTLSYADNAAIDTDAVVVGNEELATLYWSAPPADLQGLVTMPNGMVASWRANEVWFCEPYYPHAWPVPYVIAVDADIVGLGVYDQSLIILTDGQPYAAVGPDPSSMALWKIQPLEPCTSRLSIVNTPNGVLYSSPNGLINITPNGAANLTAQMTTKDQWNDLLHLNTVAAAMLSQGYYAYSLGAPAVFQADSFQFFKAGGGIVGDPTQDTPDAFQEQSEFGTLEGVFISTVDPRIALSNLQPSSVPITNVITDIFNGEVTVLSNGVVYLVDLRQLMPYGFYRWRSKIFTLPYVQNLGAAKVYWTPPYAPTPPAWPPTMFRMYAGSEATQLESGLPLVYEDTLGHSGQMFRLPSGYKALYYQFEVEGLAVIDAIHVAQTPHELREI